MENLITESATTTSEGIVASFDAGWQKRGSGRSYNSMSGHAALIGCETGKIVSYTSRSRNCAQCDSNSEKPHDCRLNWQGSAKAMEGDMAVELVKNISKADVKLNAIVADDDASSIAKIRQAVDPNIQKFSDVNHRRGNVKTDLYKLKSVHRSMNTKTINYICHCFCTAIYTNKNDT